LKSGLPKPFYEEMRRLIRCEWQEQKRHCGIYNRRPDEFDAKTGDHAKLDAIRRRLLLAEKER